MSKTFSDIVELSKYLRSPDGCPWDKEQTLLTLRKYILEEAYEVIQAIESDDNDEIVEELGDFLFQVVFASQIASEDKRFDVEDVITKLHNKLVRRHPHVFGDKKAKDAGDAVKSWQNEKSKEKSGKKRLLDVPKSMPSLLRAQRVGEKVSQLGFDWGDIQGVLDKVKEEISELENELNKADMTGSQEELGDLFFSLVNLARHMGVDAETVSHNSTDKFIIRFNKLEDRASKLNKNLTDMSPDEMEKIWEDIKND